MSTDNLSRMRFFSRLRMAGGVVRADVFAQSEGGALALATFVGRPLFATGRASGLLRRLRLEPELAQLLIGRARFDKDTGRVADISWATASEQPVDMHTEGVGKLQDGGCTNPNEF